MYEICCHVLLFEISPSLHYLSQELEGTSTETSSVSGICHFTLVVNMPFFFNITFQSLAFQSLQM